MNTQTFIDRNGERYAIIPEKDLALLREIADDKMDIEAARIAYARLERGEDERIPLETVKRLMTGENPVRVWREFRGLKARDLAVAVGISTAYLSQIETAARDGSFETIKKIAAALRVTVDDLA